MDKLIVVREGLTSELNEYLNTGWHIENISGIGLQEGADFYLCYVHIRK